MSTNQLLGAIEGGGTKFVCAVGTSPQQIVAQTTIATTTPKETLAQCMDFFAAFASQLTALGIGCFGPLDLQTDSPTYGHILATPKPHWSQIDVLGYFAHHLQIPLAWETDVNAAALGEWAFGATPQLDPMVYLTVGTGIGGGIIYAGQPWHGGAHPEIGHIMIPRATQDDFPGACPFHESCLEGLASGTALRDRWGAPGAELRTRAEVWELQAQYLALAALNLTMTLAPQRIILGGGVMQQPGLHALAHKKFVELSKNYALYPQTLDPSYLSAPYLGHRAGICGALLLAQRIIS